MAGPWLPNAFGVAYAAPPLGMQFTRLQPECRVLQIWSTIALNPALPEEERSAVSCRRRRGGVVRWWGRELRASPAS